LEIFVNFDNPLSISKGVSNDRVICKIKNTNMFRSALDPDMKLDASRTYIQKDMPPQLPKWVDEDALKREAENASNGMKVLFFLQLLIQLFLKKSLEQLFVLFFTLQVLCYMSIYNVFIPSNSQLYVAEFTKLIEFDVLNPDTIIATVTGNKDFKISDFILG